MPITKNSYLPQYKKTAHASNVLFDVVVLATS
jgi:hypothetical protein